MQLTECFEILQVDPGASWQAVKKSYYSLAKKLHPDLNPSSPETETKLKEINQAFQVLKSHFINQVGAGLVHVDNKSNTWNNIFQKVFQNPNFQKFKKNCAAYLSKLDTSLFQLNIYKTIQVPVSTAKSGGSLYMKTGQEKFEVKIPSGGWNHLSVCIPGKGEPSLFSKRRGDFILNLQTLKSKYVNLNALPSSYEMTIDRNNLGRIMTLNSSQGPIKFVLPRNTMDGQTFSLKSHVNSKRQHILKVRLN